MTKIRKKKERKSYKLEETSNKKTSNNIADSKVKSDKEEKTILGGEIRKTLNLSRLSTKLPNIKKLEENVLQYIIGQDEQVKKVITAIYRGINFKTIKSNILIVGNSGTGKTETIKQIAQKLHIPYTIEDATKYTKEGYYGADVEEMIYNLIENANRNIEKAQKGIIIIDEIDKKAGHQENDVSGTDVLKSLLKIIEGTRMKIFLKDEFSGELINFNTQNIIIIFLGAFSGLEKIREKRLNYNQLGFTNKSIINEENNKLQFSKQDLIDYGMPKEFVGRIDSIIEMNKLTKRDLALILKKSKLSIFRRYQTELKKMGILLSYNGEIFEHIAEEALATDTGARELSNIVNYMFENIIYDVFLNPNKYQKCTLDLDIVHDNTKYVLC